MMRVAHRGLAGLYPENTMIAFEKCLEYAPEAIEMDVQMTKDGELVVFHDEEVSRTTGAKGWVKDMTLAEMLELDPSNGFDIHDQKVPTLDEYFSLVEDKDLVTFVELKNSFITYPGMEEKVLECIDRHDLRKKVIVYSANHYSVMKFKAMAILRLPQIIFQKIITKGNPLMGIAFLSFCGTIKMHKKAKACAW